MRRIEEERLAAEERARLTEEETENDVQKQIFRENLENAKKAMRMSEEVEKFLQCSTKPDVQRESELTTFITMYKESKPVENL